MRDEKYKKYFWFLLLVSVIFRLIYINFLELCPDEAYYWEWSRHLALSYSDQGPVLGLITFLITHLFGVSSEFTVRLGAVIAYIGFAYLIFKMTYLIFKTYRAGFFSFLLIQVIPLAFLGSLLMVHDVPQTFFWLVSLYLIYRGFTEEKGRYWYMAGLTTGLGIMSKYTMVFFIFSIFLFLLFSDRQRRWLGRKEFYVYCLISFLMCMPIYIWNFLNNWITYHYICSLIFKHGYKAYGIKGIILYFMAQMGIISPLIFILFIILVVYLAREGFSKANDTYLYLFFTSVPLLLIFALFSVFTVVQANWPSSAYFSLIIAGGGIFSEKILPFKENKRFIYLSSLIAAYVGFAIIFITILHSLVGLFAMGERDPLTKFYGWKTLGSEISSLRVTKPDLKYDFLLSNSYWAAGELAFYVEGQPDVHCLYTGPRLRQYALWTNWEEMLGKSALYVIQNGEIGNKIKNMFESVRFIKRINIRKKNKDIKFFNYYLCKNLFYLPGGTRSRGDEARGRINP